MGLRSVGFSPIQNKDTVMLVCQGYLIFKNGFMGWVVGSMLRVPEVGWWALAVGVVMLGPCAEEGMLAERRMSKISLDRWCFIGVCGYLFSNHVMTCWRAFARWLSWFLMLSPSCAKVWSCPSGMNSGS